jgi:hypothetical protein
MPRHYCTYFDQNYLLRGLTLHRSLDRWDPGAVLWVLCLDDESHDTLVRLDVATLRPIRLADLEAADPEVAVTRAARSRIEYYFTLTPALPRYLLARHPDIDIITYVDADLHFYASPAPIFDEMSGASVLIIGHRFPAHLRHLEIHGIYNVGFLSFRNDERGLQRLEEWRSQCIEWCFDRVEPGRFADQKYLDAWAGKPGVHVLEHPGAGLAPWNWSGFRVEPAGEGATVDGAPLIFFHFHGLKIVNRWLFQPSETGYDVMPWGLRRHLYGGYLRAMSGARRWALSRVPGAGIARSASVRYARHTLRDTLGWLRRGHVYSRIAALRL